MSVFKTGACTVLHSSFEAKSSYLPALTLSTTIYRPVVGDAKYDHHMTHYPLFRENSPAHSIAAIKMIALQLKDCLHRTVICSHWGAWQGLWWLSSVADADSLQPLKGGIAMAAVEAGRGPGGVELLKLAAAQRMSTDARRAAFCVVMGSEDYIDASDRLLRLPLKVCLLRCSCLPLCLCVLMVMLLLFCLSLCSCSCLFLFELLLLLC